MSAEKPKNVGASVRQKLLNRAQQDNQEFQLILVRYALERLVHRLSRSSYVKKFILKGATLFYVWNPASGAYRPTRDLDLLMRGENSEEALGKNFQDILQTEVSPDGLSFDPNSVKVELIREDKKYGGLRVHLLVLLERARILLQIDVGFGDQISPRPEEISFPSLLGQETSRLDAYPKETVIAEKLEAMISLGEANSRMKDFYDIHFLSQNYGFKGEILSQAVEGTFMRRKTPIPEEEIYPLSRAFSGDPIRQRLWTGFLKRLGLKGVENSFEDVCRQIEVFVLPPLQSVRQKESFRAKWSAGGHWK